MNYFLPEMEHLKLEIEILKEEKQMLHTLNDDFNLKLKYALFDSEAYKRENMNLKIKIIKLEKLLNDKK